MTTPLARPAVTTSAARRQSETFDLVLDVLIISFLVLVAAAALAAFHGWAQSVRRTRSEIQEVERLAKACPAFRPVAKAVLAGRRTLDPYGYRYATEIAGEIAQASQTGSACRAGLPEID